jgi:DEAD/DEAH box helicase domain-containing protein
VAWLNHGEVLVFERVVGFKKIRFATGENVGFGEVDLPGSELHTTAIWLAFHPELAQRLSLSRLRLVDALEGLGAALRQVAAVHLMCDTRDLGRALAGIDDDGQPTPAELPTLFLYERQPGGVGFHEGLYADFGALLEAASRLLGRCPCEDGCPACVGAPAPLVSPADQPRSRRAVLSLVQVLREGWGR